MSNAGSILEAVAEYWPALMTGFVGGAGLVYLIARDLAGKPEPGLIYHDGVSPRDIRCFKEIPRENSVTKINDVKIIPVAPRDDSSNPTLVLGLEHRLKLRFSEERYLNLVRTFLGKTQEHYLEEGPERFNEELRTELTGSEVLLHSWGSKAMAISRIMIPNTSQYNSSQ